MSPSEYKEAMRDHIISTISTATLFAIESRDIKALVEIASLGGGLISEEAMGRDHRPIGFVMQQDAEEVEGEEDVDE